MTEAESHEVLLHGSDDDQLARYSAVSPLAVVALVLGLASAVALSGPILWFVPVTAAAASLAAMRRIAGHESGLIGHKAAIVGLMLAVFFGTWAPVQYFSRRIVLAGQARQAAEGWLDLVKNGHFLEAHQLMLPVGDRAAADSDLEEFYEDQPAARSLLVGFKAKPVIERLSQEPDATTRLLQTVEVSQEGEPYITLRFQIDGVGDPPVLAELGLRRLTHPSLGVVWQVEKMKEVTE